MKKFLLPITLISSSLIGQQQQITQCYELVYPSCRFESQCGWNLFLTGEALWWIAKENGLIYAQSGSSGPDVSTSELPPNASAFNFRGKIQRVDPDWDFGFRIGLGYNLCHDEWDAKASWTYYKTDKTQRNTGIFLNLWGHPDIPFSNDSSFIRADWDFHYNTLDLELGRAFGAGRCFCLRPSFGLRAAWIDQDLDLFQNVLLQQSVQNDGPLQLDIESVSDFCGAGFRFSLEGRFDVCWNFSLFGLASYSLLYGKFDTQFTEKITDLEVTDLIIADAKGLFHMGASSVQLALGLQWNIPLCCERYRFGLHIGWEQNLWFQLNQMNHFENELSRGILIQENGNLSLQGISFGARFDF